MKKLSCFVLALLTLHATAGTQEVAEPGASASASVPLLELNELELSHFSPKHAQVYELHRIASQLCGRSFFVVERGGLGSQPVPNLLLLGDQLVLYDSAQYVARLRDTLARLDEQVGGADERAVAYVSAQYAPKNLSLDSALGALSSFARNLDDGNANLAAVPERRTLILRDYAERVAEMTKVLERLDVPEPQVQITCYLLQGKRGEPDTSTAPTELVTNLERLLPDLGFSSVGFGMLQSGVVPNRVVELGVEGADGLRFDVRFQPVAYDPSTGSMTVQRCQVELFDVSAPNRATKSVLSTDTVFRGGEYTVLGATGQSPIFIVIHVRPVR